MLGKCWEPPYDAPLGLKIEHYVDNCNTQQGTAVAAMNIDSDGRITDSLITADIVRRKTSFEIDSKKSQLFEQLCQLKTEKTLKAKGYFVLADNKSASMLIETSMPDPYCAAIWIEYIPQWGASYKNGFFNFL